MGMSEEQEYLLSARLGAGEWSCSNDVGVASEHSGAEVRE